ncbi:Imm43 family immunity protein [Lysinibacillus xylanilyticus]|uniref:Imm43 family immunity protein n=1 Tax=Lysinibacillus xylanilyticus TaxID=582475 RepID=UPI003D0396D2
MGNTYAIFKKEGIFCPTYLEGIMHTEFFEKDPFEARDSDSGEWRTTRNIKTELPEELWFITKDIKYAFDLRWDSQGFFISTEFLKLLLKFGINNFQYTKLHMVNKHKESITSKEYYYVRFYDRLEDVIDMEKSNIEFYKQDGRIKKIWDLQLKESNTLPDVFLINNTSLSSILFCSEEFKKEAEKHKLKGIIFVPSNEADVYMP